MNEQIKALIGYIVYYVDYKKNFLRLNRIVLIGGPDDGVITPWESRYKIFVFFVCDNFPCYVF